MTTFDLGVIFGGSTPVEKARQMMTKHYFWKGQSYHYFGCECISYRFGTLLKSVARPFIFLNIGHFWLICGWFLANFDGFARPLLGPNSQPGLHLSELSGIRHGILHCFKIGRWWQMKVSLTMELFSCCRLVLHHPLVRMQEPAYPVLDNQVNLADFLADFLSQTEKCQNISKNCVGSKC